MNEEWDVEKEPIDLSSFLEEELYIHVNALPPNENEQLKKGKKMSKDKNGKNASKPKPDDSKRIEEETREALSVLYEPRDRPREKES